MLLVSVNLFVFMIGAIFGSFFNVCIHRLPREESLAWPPSRCPGCQKAIAFYNNVPILSFVWLRGKCSNCKTKISFRYFVIECVTAISFLWIFTHFGVTWFSPIAMLLFSLLLVATVVDLEHQIIPDEVSLGGLGFGLVISALYPLLHGSTIWYEGLLKSLVGALCGGGIIYATGVLGSIVFKKDAMGGGDVKLLAMLGAFLGWKQVLLVYLLAPVLALPIGLFVKFVKRSEIIPFGPFLSLAGWIAFLWGETLMRWYLKGFYF